MTATSTKTLIYLTQEDINNPLHPNMWAEICEQLGFQRDSNGNWPYELRISTRSAEADY